MSIVSTPQKWKGSINHIYIYWSKPGSINTPQKQDENSWFWPWPSSRPNPRQTRRQHAGQVSKNPRQKRAANRVEMLPRKAQPGTNINYLSLFASKLGCAWHYFNSSLPDTRCIPRFHYRFSCLPGWRLMVSSVQHRALDWTSWLRRPWFHSKAAQAATAPQASSVGADNSVWKLFWRIERLNCD